MQFALVNIRYTLRVAALKKQESGSGESASANKKRKQRLG